MGTTGKKRPYVKTVIFGVFVAAMYWVLLTQQELINSYCGKGGLFAVLPIGTAFIFSFMHGTFTSNFWTSLGVEASKKKTEVK